MMLLDPSKLPVRVTPDLRVTADEGAILTPAAAIGFAEHLVNLAIHRQVELGQKVSGLMPGRVGSAE